MTPSAVMLLGVSVMLLQVLQTKNYLFWPLLGPQTPTINSLGMSLEVLFLLSEVPRPAAKPYGHWLCGVPSLNYHKRVNFAGDGRSGRAPRRGTGASRRVVHQHLQQHSALGCCSVLRFSEEVAGTASQLRAGILHARKTTEQGKPSEQGPEHAKMYRALHGLLDGCPTRLSGRAGHPEFVPPRLSFAAGWGWCRSPSASPSQAD